MEINTLKDIPEIKGKKILLRVDFNVPRNDDGTVKDDSRIQAALPTIKELQSKGARLIVMSHLGRPKGEIVEDLRVTKVAEYFAEVLGHPVKKLDEVIGVNVKKAVSAMKDGDVIMLENTRFHAEEKSCDEKFAKELASLGEIFVNDAFGAAHRRHASTAGVAEHLPSYGGFLMEKEIAALSPLLEEDIARPLVMIFGGAKVDTKVGVIKSFIEKADYFLIGGAIANTFLKAAGHEVGESLYEEDKVKLAREIMMECEKMKTDIILPHDVVAASKISEDAETAHVTISDILGDMKILDIGKWTAEKFCNIIDGAGTVIWNGPLGLTEIEAFQGGTEAVANFLAKKQGITSIIGGGDTADAIKQLNIPPDAFTHISTGGGACLEFLEGKDLPGIAVLKKTK